MDLTNHAADFSDKYRDRCLACGQPAAGGPWDPCAGDEVYDESESRTVTPLQVLPTTTGR